MVQGVSAVGNFEHRLHGARPQVLADRVPVVNSSSSGFSVGTYLCVPRSWPTIW